jgi:sensor histidine kinase regulating citrate/malate metabolism
MRIATKLTLLLIAAVVAVMVAFGALCAQQERQHLISELQQETWLPANAITLTVEDSGAGMTTEELERNFEPCYSTKGRGLGTGACRSFKTSSRPTGAPSAVTAQKGLGPPYACPGPLRIAAPR